MRGCGWGYSRGKRSILKIGACHLMAGAGRIAVNFVAIAVAGWFFHFTVVSARGLMPLSTDSAGLHTPYV